MSNQTISIQDNGQSAKPAAPPVLKSGWSAIVKTSKASVSAPVSPSQRGPSVNSDLKRRDSTASGRPSDSVQSDRMDKDDRLERRETLSRLMQRSPRNEKAGQSSKIGTGDGGKSGNILKQSGDLPTARHHSADLPASSGPDIKERSASSDQAQTTEV